MVIELTMLHPASLSLPPSRGSWTRGTTAMTTAWEARAMASGREESIKSALVPSPCQVTEIQKVLQNKHTSQGWLYLTQIKFHFVISYRS